MFKKIKGHSPTYLRDLFSIRSTPYNLRDSEIKLDLPKPRTNYCKRAFNLGYSGALLSKWPTRQFTEIRLLVGIPHGNLVKQCCYFFF